MLDFHLELLSLFKGNRVRYRNLMNFQANDKPTDLLSDGRAKKCFKTEKTTGK